MAMRGRPGRDVNILLFPLFKGERFRAISAKPEMLHPPNHFAAFRLCQWIGYFEDENSSFTQIVKWLTAFRVCAVIDHMDLSVVSVCLRLLWIVPKLAAGNL
jgi:hypothetical protein